MKKEQLVNIFSSALVFLFLYASLSKFTDFKGFIYDMNNQPFPKWLSGILVWAVPAVEIGLAVMLIFNKTRLKGLYGSLILMSLFTIYTTLVLFKVFDKVPCSCGGIIKNLTWTQHSILNLFFVCIAIFGIIIMRKDKAHDTDRLPYQRNTPTQNLA
ncbi:DoxX family protein [Niastella populi]|uniref:Methylamine utilisation protein MauE domain-containing protein n=1 Tax=Niastella populi TaxID=550983 RepID=A0A1V9F7L9_9BACT|nr:MauE/DoxX family redox-associated membrane protein [Niastella populi]OQP54413.1 hypothetical protein A4R26_28045 [Niastella populi]